MGPCRLLKTIFAQFLGKYRVVSALFGKIERLTFTGTFDAFQHLVKSHSFKQICFPHRSEMGVLKSFLIDEVVLKDHSWQRKHHKMLLQSYAKAPFLHHYREFLDYIYLEKTWNSLSEMNQYLIKTISNDFLGINTKFTNSRHYSKNGTKLERLLSLLKSADAEYYLSGPAAKSYIDEEAFKLAGIELEWMDYAGYPSYPQLHSHDECIHGLSIFDLLFNVGSDAPWYIWGWRNSPHP